MNLIKWLIAHRSRARRRRAMERQAARVRQGISQGPAWREVHIRNDHA